MLYTIQLQNAYICAGKTMARSSPKQNSCCGLYANAVHELRLLQLHQDGHTDRKVFFYFGEIEHLAKRSPWLRQFNLAENCTNQFCSVSIFVEPVCIYAHKRNVSRGSAPLWWAMAILLVDCIICIGKYNIRLHIHLVCLVVHRYTT